MRLVSKLLLAGVGGVALAGVATAAERATKVIQVVLPDGSVEHIRYAGDFRPQIAIVPQQQRVVPVRVVRMPVAMVDPFAYMDRMFAALRVQHAAMMRQAAMMQQAAMSGAPRQLPPGAVSYSYSSTTTSNGGCTQTVQMTSNGQGQQPKVTRASYGACGGAQAKPMPAIASPEGAPKPTVAKALAQPKSISRDTI